MAGTGLTERQREKTLSFIEAIRPYAKMTLSERVRSGIDNSILRVIDKKTDDDDRDMHLARVFHILLSKGRKGLVAVAAETESDD